MIIITENSNFSSSQKMALYRIMSFYRLSRAYHQDTVAVWAFQTNSLGNEIKKFVLLATYHVTENPNHVLRISCFVVKALTRAIVNNTDLISFLLRYLEQEHFKSCPSETFLNGLGKLPLGTEFADHSLPDGSRPTTQKLPTGQRLSGSKTFETLMKYFTTLEITPTQLREQASNILHQLYDEVDNVCFSLIIGLRHPCNEIVLITVSSR